MLTRSGAKLMDFGLARATGSAVLAGHGSGTADPASESPTMAAPLTAQGTIVGTLQYLAPEQLEGREADARSDVWALGCVLYEMASGRRAFVATSPAALIAEIIGREPPPLASPAGPVPPGFERAVVQCLAKDPDRRWQSASDLRSEISWIAEGGGSQTALPITVGAETRRPARGSPGLRRAVSRPRCGGGARRGLAVRARPRADGLPPAELPARGRLPGRLRRRRGERRLQRRDLGQHPPGLHPPRRLSRAAAARPARDAPPRRLVPERARRPGRRPVRVAPAVHGHAGAASPWGAVRRGRSRKG